jgi:hypothetical protein
LKPIVPTLLCWTLLLSIAHQASNAAAAALNFVMFAATTVATRSGLHEA